MAIRLLVRVETEGKRREREKRKEKNRGSEDEVERGTIGGHLFINSMKYTISPEKSSDSRFTRKI